MLSRSANEMCFLIKCCVLCNIFWDIRKKMADCVARICTVVTCLSRLGISKWSLVSLGKGGNILHTFPPCLLHENVKSGLAHMNEIGEFYLLIVNSICYKEVRHDRNAHVVVWVSFIIYYFEHVNFFHAKLGLDICPNMKSQFHENCPFRLHTKQFH